MPIITFILLAAVIGLVCWLLVTYIPMPQPIKAVIVIAAVLFLVILLLQASGLWGALDTPMRVR